MKNKMEILAITILAIANVFTIAESLLDYKMDKFLDVSSNLENKYIYKK